MEQAAEQRTAMPADYRHTVKYYETDKMGITHHSNYIRWMEEARLDFLQQIGWGYEKLESEGIVSPVTAVEARYKAPTTFPDEVAVRVRIEEFRGAVLKIAYTMTKADGQLVFEGRSEHCFLDREGRVIRLKREFPEFSEALASFLPQEG